MQVRRRKWLWALVAVVLAGGAALAIFGDQVASRLAGGARQQDQGVAGLPTYTVRQGNIQRTITATGNVQPARLVDLRFGVAGRVKEVRVETGQRVEAGEVLAVLDNRQQELAYFQARNAYEVARIDAAPNTVREREIDMQLAQEALEQTYLRAPFAGVVTAVLVEPGQSINTNEVVVQLMDDSVFQVQVSVDELDIAQVQVGQPATIRLDADPGRVRRGVVQEVSLVANVQGGVVTVPVTVRFLETDPFLRPGYTATVQIEVAVARGVPVVPVEAIWEEGDTRTVTRLVNGEPEVVPVETGLSDGAWVEIRSGLNIGDQVVALNYRGGGGTSAGATRTSGPGGFGGFGGGFGVRVPGFPVR